MNLEKTTHSRHLHAYEENLCAINGDFILLFFFKIGGHD